MEKNIYALIVKVSHPRFEKEKVSKTLELDDDKYKEMLSKIERVNKVVYEIDDRRDLDCLDDPDYEFYPEDDNIFLILKKSKTIEEVKGKLDKEWFGEDKISYIEDYFKEIKGTIFERHFITRNGASSYFELRKVN